jgi:hypothetical protein
MLNYLECYVCCVCQHVHQELWLITQCTHSFCRVRYSLRPLFTCIKFVQGSSSSVKYHLTTFNLINYFMHVKL